MRRDHDTESPDRNLNDLAPPIRKVACVMTDRPDIPAAVKREVRQKCHFGCVLCGMPIYNFDHIEKYSVVREHDPNNLVLLCPNHHAEKTSGRLSQVTVEKALSAPFNKVRMSTTPHLLHMTGDEARFEVGGNAFEFSFSQVRGYFQAIVLAGQTVVGMRLENDRLLIDLTLNDPQGKAILEVARGELSISTGVWDFEMVGPRIVIRSAERQISLELEILANGIAIRRGLFIQPPITLRVEPSRFTSFPDRNVFQGCTIRGQSGLMIT